MLAITVSSKIRQPSKLLLQASLFERSHTNQYRRLGYIMVRVTQNANGTRLHHHTQRKIQRVLQPSFGESAEDVAMGNLERFSMLQV